MRDGGDVVIFATGHMVAKALEAAELLQEDRVGARVVNVSTIKPVDGKAILAETAGVRHAFSVEEHNTIGGLGSAIAEILSEEACIPLRRLGVEDQFGESGLADELLEKHGLQARGISSSVVRALGV
jgi:transketolase